jgi:hypothetical protein
MDIFYQDSTNKIETSKFCKILPHQICMSIRNPDPVSGSGIRIRNYK